ncbi:MAG: pantoate--beta-alanine ligase [Halothermotrichaceae bacterium]
MKIYSKAEVVSTELEKIKKDGNSIGFVPTMGFLHEGHLSLVREAVKANDTIIVSIFVNPAQFGPDEDYDTYPRDLESDAAKLEKLDVDYIFSPEVGEMYPEGYNTFVEVKGLTENLCGSSRPHFFRGVTTVVNKLFNIIKPDRAYFGQKDFQQLMVIKRMVKDLNIPVEIIGLPIIREEDGLALSSRNKYLSSKEREQALVLNQSLNIAEDMIINNGIISTSEIKKAVINRIESKELTEIDYVAAVNPQTLKDIKKIENEVLLALAVFVGDTRLIDNRLINLSQ